MKDAGTGTTSLDTPLKAVGNTDYNGNNPPKYLNAEFNYFKVKDARGVWTEIAPGARIEVKADKPVLCQASIGNLQVATWIAPSVTNPIKGSVYLATSKESQIQTRVAIPKDTAYFSDAVISEFTLCANLHSETTLVLQMTAIDRAWFGEKLSFTLVPSP